jgi:uncharacterized coiled-coil DUF342 family protein
MEQTYVTTETFNEFSKEFKEFKEEMREFKEEMREFKEEMREFKEEMREFKTVSTETFSLFFEEFKEFKKEMREFKKESYRRFEYLERRMDRIENLQMEDHKILMELWQSRDKVTVNFSRTFTFVNAFISCFVATITSLFVSSKA